MCDKPIKNEFLGITATNSFDLCNFVEPFFSLLFCLFSGKLPATVDPENLSLLEGVK